MIYKSCFTLHNYIQQERYKGYDPYDTLSSPIPFRKFGNMVPALAIQFQKYNPVNIRKLLGIKKDYVPKGLGLLLKAYCLLNRFNPDKFPISIADSLFELVKDCKSNQYELPCWGVNFDLADPKGYRVANTPSSVGTSIVLDGVLEYYYLSGSEEAKDMIIGGAKWIGQNIPIIEYESGISYSYTPHTKGSCYNASLFAIELLAKADVLSGEYVNTENINKAIDYVLSKQKNKGEWWYSFNPTTGNERKQIDFHQGFVLSSLNRLNNLLLEKRLDIEVAIDKGLKYYKNYQFYANGKSLWRIPKAWPVDIHNQSQGIITFSELANYGDEYQSFANTIAQWTIENMQDEKGYFYYRIFKHHKNKISYMRWSQAWMLLALAVLLNKEKDAKTHK